MSAIECIHSLLKLKYVGIFDYIKDPVFMEKNKQSTNDASKNSFFLVKPK